MKRTLADVAEHELEIAVKDSATTPDILLSLLSRWYSDPACSERTNLLLTTLLNEAAALLANPRFREAAWQFYHDVALEAGRQNDEDLQAQLTIALFEIIPESPAIPADVKLLFTLLDSPDSRWAVFAAYEQSPESFRRDIQLYGCNRITDEEYENWLTQRTSCNKSACEDD